MKINGMLNLRIIGKTGLRLLIAIVLIISCLLITEYIYFREKANPGIFVGQIYVGGKFYGEIDAILEEMKMDLESKEILIYLPDKEMELKLSLAEMGISLDKEKMLEEIVTLSSSLNYLEKIKIYRSGKTLPGLFTISEVKFNSLISNLNERNHSAQNAEVWAEDGIIKFKPHEYGRILNLDHLDTRILDILYYWPSYPIEMPVDELLQYPEVTTSKILEMGIKDEITAAGTLFDQKDQNRAHNIVLAAKSIDNIVLAPGDLFSFNQIVGDASLAAGYRDAPIIVNEQIVMGAGGGICQVSSTLYNAVLLAGLKIEERYNHGLPVGYLPPGLDATISYNYLDLKFSNNSSSHLLIHMQVLGNQLKAVLFGDPSQKQEIKIITQNFYTIAPPVHYRQAEDRPSTYKLLIQEGKPGYTVETIRIFYEKGEEVFREHLGKDYYAPRPDIYAVGTQSEEG
ncbi:MAG: VanW family protein [Bacillota bacterium]|nr:VanW family protein [Bacillota bacterium]